MNRYVEACCTCPFIPLLTWDQVTTKYINGLIELIHSNLNGNQHDSTSVETSRKHFHQTLENIKSRQYEGVVLYPS